MVKKLFLTGYPSVGKTTLLVRVLQGLGKVPASGFYTQEIRQDGIRWGFRAVTLAGKEITLAHSASKSPQRVSRYGVELEAFEEEILPSIDPALSLAPFLVIDEIGRMECLSPLFREVVARALDSERVVLGTIALRGGGFIAQVKARPDVELVEVTLANRESLVGELRECLLGLLQSRAKSVPPGSRVP